MILCLSGLPLMAAGAAEAEELRTKLRFHVHGRGEFHDVLLLTPSGKAENLQLVRGRRSRGHDYIGPAELKLLRTDGVDEAGRPQYDSVGSVVLPDVSEVLVFLLANPAFGRHPDMPEFQLFAMEDNSRSVPLDHLVFYNLTGAPLQGVVGNRAVELGRGLSKPVDVRPFFDESEVLVGLKVRSGGISHIVMENRLRFVPDRRTVIVLLPPVRTDSFEIQAFKVVDYVRPEERE